jgi:putative DNA primase/helicase
MIALDDALRFHSLGLSLIPLKAGTKEPDTDVLPNREWRPFQTARPSIADVQQWFGNGVRRNIGIPLGVVSGVVAIETDSPEAEEWCAANLPPTPMMTRSARGIHRFYRLPTGPNARADIPSTITIPGGTSIEIKKGGQYLVGPGSVHPGKPESCIPPGHVYTEVEPWPTTLDAVPEFPIAIILDVVGRSGASDTTAEALPRDVEAGDRNNRLFREACRLRRQGLEPVEILAALTAINRNRCRPPLDSGEVETIARSAARYPQQADTFPLTEVGDAEFFAGKHGEQVRFDHAQQRWLVLSDTGIWIPDPVEQLRVFTVDVMRDRQRHAIAIKNTEQKKAALKWAVTGESTKRISNTLREARALPPIADDGSNWDAAPFLLGAPNGVVDLQTGTLRMGRPEDRITMRVRVPYDPVALCPLWERTITEVFDGDAAVIAYIQRALGYSSTGDCREECFFVTWGEGGNGKGTVMNTVAWVVGDYADDLPFSALELRERSSIPADIAKLVGRRFVTASESGETTQFNVARIKALTGRDPITARLLHKNFFTFQPVGKFWLATNSKPIVRDDSDGFWCRVHLIPFTQSFTGRADKTLKDRLREEAPGILAWLVRGALAWQREGLNPPDVVRAATEEYRHENEPLTPFLEACCRGNGRATCQSATCRTGRAPRGLA